MSGNLKYNYLHLVCLLALVTSGCAEISMMYHGNPVSAVDVVSFQGRDSDAGRWETFDLIIDYQYAREGDEFALSAEVALGQHQQMNYDALQRLDVYLFFIDENLRVLETFIFLRNTSNDPEERMDVSRRYKIPHGATGLSFGYSGVVGEWGGSASFYQLPLGE